MKTTILLLVSSLTIGFVCGGAVVEKGCGNDPADLIFVLDDSGSIYGPNFNKQMVFVNSIVSALDVGPQRTRVGVLVFSTQIRTICQLGDYKDVQDLKRKIAAVHQTRGNTHTDEALKKLREEMFSRQYARPNVPHVAIVITDGASDYFDKTKDEAQLCRNDNIQMYAVGIGQVSTAELNEIAGDPDRVSTADSYDTLGSLQLTLNWQKCKPATNPPAPEEAMIEGCRDQKLLDTIWSISDQAGVEETDQAIDFIKTLTTDMTIDRQHVRVGLAPRFCDEAKEIKLMDHDTASGFNSALDKRRITGLRTEQTLEYIRTKGHSASSGGRSDAVKYGILIVDNKPQNWKQTLEKAHRAKSEGGVHLIVIGVGDRVDEVKMSQIASSSEHYFHIDSYAELPNIKTAIEQTLCDGIITPGDQNPGPGVKGQKTGQQVKQRDYYESSYYY